LQKQFLQAYFFGIGTSTFASGTTANLAFISVYKLELAMESDSDGKFAKLQLHAPVLSSWDLLGPKCMVMLMRTCVTPAQNGSPKVSMTFLAWGFRQVGF
jgi:hypothetical protein